MRKLAINVSDALKRRAFKPDITFNAEPVPAGNPQIMSQDYKYRPGHYAPDPVPARRPPQIDSVAIDLDNMTWEFPDTVGPDPIPAENFWED